MCIRDRQIAEQFPGLTAQANAVSVHTTLDINLQRLALDAVRDGLARVDDLLARRKRKGRPQAALVAVDPQTGEILAMVGGRSYNQSQYNRATTARRQPGSVFKPFVYLAAFEHGAEEGRIDLTPASLTNDAPETFTFNNQTWEPKNYDDYDGEITWRRALAMSRNLGTVHVGAAIDMSGCTAPPLVNIVYASATSSGVNSNTPSVIAGYPCGGVPTPTRFHTSATLSNPIAAPT